MQAELLNWGREREKSNTSITVHKKKKNIYIYIYMYVCMYVWWLSSKNELGTHTTNL